MAGFDTAADMQRFVEALVRARFVGDCEADLHAGVAELLTRLGIAHEEEYRLDEQNRVDFLAGTAGIEIKTQGSTAALARQLQRYSASPAIDEIVVVTSRATHRELPPAIGDIPIAVVVVGGLA